MNKLKCMFILIASATLLGCQSTHRVQSYKAPPQPLQRDAGIFIVIPPDAFDEPGSGRFAADALQAAFVPYASRIKLSDEIAPLNIHLTNATVSGFHYLLESTIYKWAEEDTEWSGLSDKLDIKLRLLQISDGAAVSETRFDAHCSWLSIGSRVEHLLKALTSEWVRALYEGVDFRVPAPATKPKASAPRQP